MSDVAAKWDDLRVRVLSAVVMVVVGGIDLWLGGIWLLLLLALVAAAMVWEAARMGGAERGALRDVALPVAAGLSVIAAERIGSPYALVLPAVVAAGVHGLSHRLRHRLALYAFFSMIAALALFAIREVMGLNVLLWLIAVVIASDVMGYFGGRLLGGPKFWPAVSPKKTWSGTIAGWLGAALVGWLMLDMISFVGKFEWPVSPVLLSVLLAFAAQMGDIVESALKRKAGVKDSSSLIPGHGGVLDRFDGMIGAGLVFWPLVFLAGLIT